jgi:uncharacterized protein with NRDE domain
VGRRAGVAILYARQDGAREVQRLGTGVHVLCNDRLGAPGFPRGERLATALARPAAWPDVVAELEQHLGDHTRVDPPPSHLPEALARELTATCIHSPTYGTRSSTVLALGEGRVIAYRHADGPPCVTPFREVAV